MIVIGCKCIFFIFKIYTIQYIVIKLKKFNKEGWVVLKIKIYA